MVRRRRGERRGGEGVGKEKGVEDEWGRRRLRKKTRKLRRHEGGGGMGTEEGEKQCG